jgi:hypothetical protein
LLGIQPVRLALGLLGAAVLIALGRRSMTSIAVRVTDGVAGVSLIGYTTTHER